ncbi:MAG: hypothetical protein U0234_30815 [Sandaracinus sp.]
MSCVRPAGLAVFSALALSAILPSRASAARVLFVSDGHSDAAIESVLRGDGHDVTRVDDDFVNGLNDTLEADLSGFDCVVWSATNDGTGAHHTDSLVFSNLEGFVADGGSVFVTGAGSISHGDTMLVDFLGGTRGNAFTGAPAEVVDLETSLTTGVVDIRGIVPTDYAQQASEALSGLRDDTTVIVSARLLPAGAQWSLRSLGSGQIAFVAGIVNVDAQWLMETSGADGAYNAALRNFVASSEGTASAPGAPRVRFAAPFTAEEGAALHVEVSVTDDEGDSTTFSWDLDGDGTYGEHPNEAAIDVPAGTTDGPSSFVVAVEASDGVRTTRRSRAIAVSNEPPAIVSRPPSLAAIGLHVRYALDVRDPGGVHDPLAFDLRTGPATAVVTSAGVFDWTPGEAEVTAAGTMRSIAIDVADGDGAQDSQRWSMVVLDDHAPTDPTLLFPVMDAPVLLDGLRLSIGNASDLDGDPISYRFELDSSPAFDSVDLQHADAVMGSPTGITIYTPDPSALHEGPWYWRVRASDGRVETFPVGASFQIVPDPATFPDAGADAGPDGGTGSPGGGTCACRAGAGRSSPLAALVGAFVISALGVARRRPSRARR